MRDSKNTKNNDMFFDEESHSWTKFIGRIAGEASEKARQRAFEKGFPVLLMKDGRLHYEHPEGVFTLIGEDFYKK